MQREREKGQGKGIQDRVEEGMGRESARESLVRDDSWHRVWKSRVVAGRATEKANQQLVAPYRTREVGGLVSIDFRYHGTLSVVVKVMSRGMRGLGWIVNGCRDGRECPRLGFRQNTRRGLGGWAGPLSKKGPRSEPRFSQWNKGWKGRLGGLNSSKTALKKLLGCNLGTKKAKWERR